VNGHVEEEPVSDYETIRYETAERLATITLNRPDKRNAMNATMFTELGDAAERAAGDDETRAVLVRGQGASFCAGIDLTSLGDLMGADKDRIEAFILTAQRPYRVLQTLSKPVVAAVQGHALGAGFQLALACDLRVLGEDASLGMLEIQFGIVPDLGGNHSLAALAGPSRAKELVWTGRRIDAPEADRLGLATAVVPTERVGDEAESLARTLAAKPPLPVGYAKSIIAGAAARGLEATMDEERRAQLECLSSEDHREAVAAFFEKRPGEFRGR
jgi:enoyl-CoA hydratase/carnithine racemase